MNVTRLGTAAAADVLLADVRGRRHRLAATIRSALLDLDRHPLDSFPNARKAQREHEQQALETALAALLAPAPEPIPTDRLERELWFATRELAA